MLSIPEMVIFLQSIANKRNEDEIQLRLWSDGSGAFLDFNGDDIFTFQHIQNVHYTDPVTPIGFTER